MQARRPPPGNIVRGVLRLARGQRDGFEHFGATREAVLASLAPLIAFPLVGGALLLVSGGGVMALSDLLATFCALLAPLVLTFEAARLWGRAALWPRFATAFNWCQWAIPVVGSLLLLVLGLATGAGLSRHMAAGLAVIGLACYGLWLHWFLARHGLGLPRLRALLLVIGVNMVTVAIVIGPRMLVMAAGGAGMDGK